MDNYIYIYTQLNKCQQQQLLVVVTVQVVHHQPPPPTLSNYLLHTVGTTKFNALIQSIDTPQFHATAIKHNFTKILIQKGTGSYIPTKYTSITHSINVEVATTLPISKL